MLPVVQDPGPLVEHLLADTRVRKVSFTGSFLVCDDADQAVAIANRSELGLAAYVYTADLARGIEEYLETLYIATTW